MKFHDENGIMKESLVLEDAKNIVSKIVVKNQYNKVDERQSITSAQLRKFYNEFKTIEKNLQVKANPSEAFISVLPKIKISIAKVQYVKSRKLVPESFVAWLEDCVKSIHTYKDFEAFLLHFEAVVGFAYGEGLNN